VDYPEQSPLYDEPAHLDLSVVIPTRNRRARLLSTLAALDAQALEGDRAEIIVVDDGSDDGTAAAVSIRSSTLPTRVLTGPRSGASAARNRGIAAATGSAIALLGDDTAPADRGLLAGHIALHRSESDPLYAVLGRIAWAPAIETPFMRWTETAGFHVSFDRIRPGIVPTAVYLYSSHTSIKRSTLLDVGGFDESFPFGEDTELGSAWRGPG
jgi:glycosyltransferase involved in cell wall biosynthesis